MNRYITPFILALLLIPDVTFAQEGYSTSTYSKPNYIRSGFTLKIGPVIPIGSFAAEQVIIDLTGKTIEWHFRNRDGTIPTSTPIIGTIIDAVNGKVDFDLPSELTTTKTKYHSVMKILQGVTLISNNL